MTKYIVRVRDAAGWDVWGDNDVEADTKAEALAFARTQFLLGADNMQTTGALDADETGHDFQPFIDGVNATRDRCVREGFTVTANPSRARHAA